MRLDVPPNVVNFVVGTRRHDRLLWQRGVNGERDHTGAGHHTQIGPRSARAVRRWKREGRDSDPSDELAPGHIEGGERFILHHVGARGIRKQEAVVGLPVETLRIAVGDSIIRSHTYEIVWEESGVL